MRTIDLPGLRDGKISYENILVLPQIDFVYFGADQRRIRSGPFSQETGANGLPCSSVKKGRNRSLGYKVKRKERRTVIMLLLKQSDAEGDRPLANFILVCYLHKARQLVIS
ncbi:MAG: hypothetical protein K0B01_11965 [Syntrophobacterales bacterium]|nr:hypothetical protein [Syntrophobacterales bacterium]